MEKERFCIYSRQLFCKTNVKARKITDIVKTVNIRYKEKVPIEKRERIPH